ncbi:MAG: elongation factor G [Chloroflexi bacterium]|nr:elongation factor G [Chloroflexota bacterium]
MRSFRTDAIRNVVLLGHSGDGKTTLSEMFLRRSGAISRLGRVEDGTTASDHEPEEHRRGGSVNLSVLPMAWRDHKINLLDPPGYLDFLGETIAAVRVADGALIIADASTGPKVGTDMAWKRAEQAGLATIIAVNKMDRENADFVAALEGIRTRYGTRCVATHIPIGAEKTFAGVVDILTGRAFLSDGRMGGPPDELAEQIAALRNQLIEAIAETDDQLATKFLEGEDLTADELRTAFVAAVHRRMLFPVIAASGTWGHGIEAVLDVFVDVMPSPVDVEPRFVPSSDGGSMEISSAAEGPLAAFVFKTTADPFVGKLSFFRVYSGTIVNNSHVWNSAHAQSERIAQAVTVSGKHTENVDTVPAGDIAAVAKLAFTATGDTLTTREAGIVLPKAVLPEAIYSVSVEPKTKADTDKLGAALTRLVDEDPSLQMHREGETHQVILAGLGDSHIDVAVQRLHRKFGVDVEAGTPKVPYRESIRTGATAEYRHRKQTGGHGQYAHVVIELEPLHRGSGFEFGQRVVGGAVPKNFIPAVEKGVREALPMGALAHFPIVDLKATLVDGSFHAVDSSEMAFKIAASMALRKGIQEANPVILEPVMTLHVICPDEFTGDVIGHLNSRRARVHGMSEEEGITTIEAEAPMSEVLRYSTDLRSMTQGRGSYEMVFAHYAEVPAHLTQHIMEESNKLRAEV